MRHQRQSIIMELYNSVMKATVNKCWAFISFAFWQFLCQCRVQNYNEIQPITMLGKTSPKISSRSQINLG